MLAADFLEANFDKVFGHYQKLLHSENYVTRRQSLKLLGELLLDRHNFSVSNCYLSMYLIRGIYLTNVKDATWMYAAVERRAKYYHTTLLILR